ncbi:Short-chain dehydrogenase/reductase SDR [Fusarium oxysporum f. sp. vasinfectum]|nr:Short-chain dehydrogenase/reductase SDR [Fusarium oxysporum f. sp. vasinfectum]
MSRYADAHKNTSGPGDARPTALQIVRDEDLEGALTDKVFLITGTSAGIGVEVGRAIAATGARVFLAVRDLEKGKAACSSFLKPGQVDLIRLDTADMSSVRACAAEFLEKSPTLNVLINNAAIMATPTRIETKDGFEQQLATNYLGHFLLFWLLKDALLKGSTSEFNSRLVNVSSSGHHASEVIYDDFQLKAPDAYNPFKAYGQSKLAQIYMSNYIDRVYGPKGLHATSVMPGGIASNLQKHLPEAPQQGAATTVLAAVGKEWEGKGGKYLENCRPSTPQPLILGMMGYKDYIYVSEKENRTWELTLETLGLQETS